MAKSKGRKIIKSFSFDPEVCRALEVYCKKEGIKESLFVNNLIKKATMSEYEFYRQLTKFHASELSKYQMLMDTAPDKPKGG